MSDWQPKETMPKEDARFLAALRVYNTKGEFTHWDVHVLELDAVGIIDTYYHGWELKDYELWCHIPPLPVP